MRPTITTKTIRCIRLRIDLHARCLVIMEWTSHSLVYNPEQSDPLNPEQGDPPNPE